MASQVSLDQALGRVEGKLDLVLENQHRLESQIASSKTEHGSLEARVSSLESEAVFAKRILWALGAALGWLLGHPYVTEYFRR